MVVVEGLPEAMGGSLERAKVHYSRALELNRGERAGTYVTWASMVSLRRQDAKEFRQMLEKALAIDPDAVPAERLANLLQQRKARRLLAQIDELFLDLSEAEKNPPADSNQ
jgi:predicted anti-sigma-YlaC factor YlaD